MISLQHCRGQECTVSTFIYSLSMYRSYRPYQPLAKGLVSRNKLVCSHHRSQHSTDLPQVDTSCAHNGCSSCGSCISVSSFLEYKPQLKGASPLPQTPIRHPIQIVPIANETCASHMVENQTSSHWTEALLSVQ